METIQQDNILPEVQNQKVFAECQICQIPRWGTIPLKKETSLTKITTGATFPFTCEHCTSTTTVETKLHTRRKVKFVTVP